MAKKTLTKEKPKLPDIELIGAYRIGMTGDEIKEYLKQVFNIVTKKNRKECPAKILKQFNEIAGVNTMGVSPTGEGLMYRFDVERFTMKLFFNQPTVFD